MNLSNTLISDMNQQQVLHNLLRSQGHNMVPPADLNPAKQQLIDALKFIPENKVVAYRTALEQNPSLVATESNLYKFLIRSEYNGWEVASRLCEYWTLRREVFGEGRWLKPVLDLTPGIGALSETSKQIINLDVCKIIPYDQYGRAMLLCDRYNFSQKVKKKFGIETSHKFEYMFYVFQLLSELPGIGTQGFYFVYLLHEKKPEIYPAVHKFFARAVRECFPIRINNVNVIFAPLKEKDSSLAKTFMPYAFEFLKLPFAFTSVKLDYIKPDKSGRLKPYRRNLADFLVHKCSMKSEFLPKLAGGTWSLERFLTWKKSRLIDDSNTLTVAHPLPEQMQHQDVQSGVHTNGSVAVSSPLDLLAYAALQTASTPNAGIKRERPHLDPVSAKKPRSGP